MVSLFLLALAKARKALPTGFHSIKIIIDKDYRSSKKNFVLDSNLQYITLVHRGRGNEPSTFNSRVHCHRDDPAEHHAEVFFARYANPAARLLRAERRLYSGRPFGVTMSKVGISRIHRWAVNKNSALSPESRPSSNVLPDL